MEDATLHGGRLEVWSRRGEGTNFVLTLPRGIETGEFTSPVTLVPADAEPDRPQPGRKRSRRAQRVGS
jgi:two-component system sensor histidine kinase MtrB